MLNIYTHDPSLLSREFWKATLRPLFGKYSGPDAVRDSLQRGLSELGIPYIINPTKPEHGEALVLSGPEALKTAIAYKKLGIFTKLLAGPNIVINPEEYNSLLLAREIDKILVPAPWVADLWRQVAPSIAKGLFVWPSGVAQNEASNRSGMPIIYDKLGDADLLQNITNTIEPVRVFQYSRFRRSEYLEALKDAPYLVYLSRSESQGLALQEAWAHDVPTLVNHSDHWAARGLSWTAPQINCPYLTPELGAIFADPAEIPIITAGLDKLSPKQYCDKHLSDRASVEKLLRLIP